MLERTLMERDPGDYVGRHRLPDYLPPEPGRHREQTPDDTDPIGVPGNRLARLYRR